MLKIKPRIQYKSSMINDMKMIYNLIKKMFVFQAENFFLSISLNLFDKFCKY